MGRRKNFTGQSFLARGYHVSTIGRDEAIEQASGSARGRDTFSVQGF